MRSELFLIIMMIVIVSIANAYRMPTLWQVLF